MLPYFSKTFYFLALKKRYRFTWYIPLQSAIPLRNSSSFVLGILLEIEIGGLVCPLLFAFYLDRTTRKYMHSYTHMHINIYVCSYIHMHVHMRIHTGFKNNKFKLIPSIPIHPHRIHFSLLPMHICMSLLPQVLASTT